MDEQQVLTAEPEPAADATQQTKFVSLREQLAFYFSALLRDMSYAIMGTDVTTNFFLTIGLTGKPFGAVTLLRRLWDGLNDPLMGAYFDRRAYQDEKARRYFKTTGIPIAVLMLLMFLPVNLTSGGTRPWLFAGFLMLCYLPFEAMHTINGTAYMSYYNSITPNIQEREGIISRARVFSTLGTAAAGGVIPVIIGFFEKDNVQAKTWVYSGASIVVAAAFIIYSTLMYTQVKERIVSPPQAQQKIWGVFKTMLHNKLFLIMMLSNAIGGLLHRGNLDMQFYDYNIGNTAWQSAIGIAGFPTLLLASWLVPKLCQRFEKRDIYLASQVLKIALKAVYLVVGTQSVSMTLLQPIPGQGPKVFAAVIAMLTELPNSVRNILYWSMIADSVDYLEWKTGKRNDGTIYAMEGLLGKLVGSVGALSTVIIIKMIKFVPNAKAQTPATMRGLLVVPNLIEIVSIAASAIPYFFYDLKRRGHAKLIEELKERNAVGAAIEAVE